MKRLFRFKTWLICANSIDHAWLQFDREAVSLASAVADAIEQIGRCGYHPLTWEPIE